MDPSNNVTIDDDFFETLEECVIEKRKGKICKIMNNNKNVKLLIKINNCCLNAYINFENKDYKISSPNIYYSVKFDDSPITENVKTIINKIDNILHKKLNYNDNTKQYEYCFICKPLNKKINMKLMTRLLEKDHSTIKNYQSCYIGMDYCTICIDIHASIRYCYLVYNVVDIGSVISIDLDKKLEKDSTIHFSINKLIKKEKEKKIRK